MVARNVKSLLAQMDDSGVWPWQEKSSAELNEDSALTKDRLDALTRKIDEYSESHPNFRPLMDEDFLMAFLRSRKFSVENAFKSFVGFYKIRLCNPDCIFPSGKGPLDYRAVFELPLATLIKRRNPYDGTVVVVWIFKHFDHRKHRLEDTFNATFTAAMSCVGEPAMQVYGIRFLFDIEGMSLALAPLILSKLYFIKALAKAQSCFPARFKGFHVINEPFGVGGALFKLVKPFLSEKMCERVRFHGRDMNSVHEYISPEILPREYGGSAAPIDNAWILSTLSELHDDLVEKSNFGFTYK